METASVCVCVLGCWGGAGVCMYVCLHRGAMEVPEIRRELSPIEDIDEQDFNDFGTCTILELIYRSSDLTCPLYVRLPILVSFYLLHIEWSFVDFFFFFVLSPTGGGVMDDQTPDHSFLNLLPNIATSSDPLNQSSTDLFAENVGGELSIRHSIEFTEMLPIGRVVDRKVAAATFFKLLGELGVCVLTTKLYLL